MGLRNNIIIRQIYYTYQNWLNHRSYCHGSKNRIKIDGYRVDSRIQIQGSNNQVAICRMGGCKNSLIHIFGNNNKIIIGDGALVSGAELWIEDNDCLIEIGAHSFVGHHSHLACTENGSQLIIGDDCMLSSYVSVRTGDSHSILDADGNRINLAKSVYIGNHCWLGESVKILKGVSLKHDVIVSTGAIVTKSFANNVIIGGIPAKVLKEDVSWDSKRI